MTSNCDISFLRFMQEAWLDGVRILGDHKYRLAEAEKREVRFRTSIEEVTYALAGRRLMEQL